MMTIMVDVHHIEGAKAREFDDFSTVKISTAMGKMTLFFNSNKAQAVVDAINAAIDTQVSE